METCAFPQHLIENARRVAIEPRLELAHAHELFTTTAHHPELAGDVLSEEVRRHTNRFRGFGDSEREPQDLTLHRGADVLDWFIIPGATLGSLVLGVSALGSGPVSVWTWRDRADMPEPMSRRGASDYDEYLAGEGVLEIFEELLASIS